MHLSVNRIALVISSILAAASARAADNTADSDASATLDEVIVTAQKRSENLQQVPLSVVALETPQLQQLHVNDFHDYTKFLPSLSSPNGGPGQDQLFIRGLTNGTDGLRVGSQPTVAVYLDEQPVTTIGNNLDVHMYDIARVEELSGPQGTLFGSSSLGGTLRIITNKPSTDRFEAAYSLDGNMLPGAGSKGGKVEGYVNVPVSNNAAVRLVAFTEHDGGYVNNVLGPPEVWPTAGVPRSNAAVTQKNFNPVDTTGARGALKFDLDRTWTITPSAMGQYQKAHGIPAYNPFVGDLNVVQYFADENVDRWWQAALTIEGHISRFDVVYAGAYIDREVHSIADYSEYLFDYDLYYAATPLYFGDF
ncbi:MAG TPA: TonB-dependent receptor plug domain-containing protein, partial [Steroidobacteraceae bacterium]|nr:TonB-dependent receptor plug domain-containing protein [Steroidobacteraceae bacterium]